MFRFLIYRALFDPLGRGLIRDISSYDLIARAIVDRTPSPMLYLSSYCTRLVSDRKLDSSSFEINASSFALNRSAKLKLQ